MNDILAKIGLVAIGLFIGGLVMKVTTDRAWEAKLAGAKPTLIVRHDTVESPPIVIVRRLNPIVKHDTVRVISSSELDSTASYWAGAILNFWLGLGYDAQGSYNMQDSLTIQRGFEIENDKIGYLKVSYLPLPDFTLTVNELRPPHISNDTTLTTPPIVIPKTFFDYLEMFGGYALALIFAILAVK